MCDAYSAMTSDRPYSRPRSSRSALRELERGAGTQFDPGVAAALASLIRGSRFRRGELRIPAASHPRPPAAQQAHGALRRA